MTPGSPLRSGLVVRPYPAARAVDAGGATLAWLAAVAEEANGPLVLAADGRAADRRVPLVAYNLDGLRAFGLAPTGGVDSPVFGLTSGPSLTPGRPGSVPRPPRTAVVIPDGVTVGDPELVAAAMAGLAADGVTVSVPSAPDIRVYAPPAFAAPLQAVASSHVPAGFDVYYPSGSVNSTFGGFQDVTVTPWPAESYRSGEVFFACGVGGGNLPAGGKNRLCGYFAVVRTPGPGGASPPDGYELLFTTPAPTGAMPDSVLNTMMGVGMAADHRAALDALRDSGGRFGGLLYGLRWSPLSPYSPRDADMERLADTLGFDLLLHHQADIEADPGTMPRDIAARAAAFFA